MLYSVWGAWLIWVSNKYRMLKLTKSSRQMKINVNVSRQPRVFDTFSEMGREWEGERKSKRVRKRARVKRERRKKERARKGEKELERERKMETERDGRKTLHYKVEGLHFTTQPIHTGPCHRGLEQWNCHCSLHKFQFFFKWIDMSATNCWSA